jgi:hypothetical protein
LLQRRQRRGVSCNIRKGGETVTQINNINENTAVQTGQRSSAKPAAGFRDSLETALAEKSAGKTESGQATALGEPQAAHFNPAISPATDDDIACQTDNLLDLLESYSKGLEAPEASLKDLAPLVDRIKDGAQQLMASADNDAAAGELKDIASQAALTANIEYIKFQRGDYV